MSEMFASCQNKMTLILFFFNTQYWLCLPVDDMSEAKYFSARKECRFCISIVFGEGRTLTNIAIGMLVVAQWFGLCCHGSIISRSFMRRSINVHGCGLFVAISSRDIRSYTRVGIITGYCLNGHRLVLCPVDIGPFRGQRTLDDLRSVTPSQRDAWEVSMYRASDVYGCGEYVAGLVAHHTFFDERKRFLRRSCGILWGSDMTHVPLYAAISLLYITYHNITFVIIIYE